MANPSVVDYLNSAGRDSSFSARKELASKMGVQNYTGSAQQNTSLLNSLRQLLTKPESAPRALSTPSQIPTGSRALTSASEIPNYNITGQVGKTGAPGSYLYGTPRQLPGATPGVAEAPAGSQTGAGEQSPQEPQVPLKDQVLAILKASQSVPAIDGSEAELKKRREAIIQARFGSQSGALPEAFKGLSVGDEVSFRQGQRKGLQEELSGIDRQLSDIADQRKSEEARLKPIEVGGVLYQVQADGSYKPLTSKEEKHSPEFVQWQEYVGAGGKLGLNEWTTAEDKKKLSRVKAGAWGADGGKTYATDLDAIIGATLSTIPTKFGQEQFQTQLNRTRNDADKVSLVASQVLKGQGTDVKRDFSNQSFAIKEVDKAIALLDEKIKTGAIKAVTQYVYNIFGKDFDPNLAKVNAYITSAIQPYRNSITGAAWGEQEDREYQQLFGSTKYSPSELRQRLVQIKEIMKDKSIAALNSFVNPLDTYTNPFSQEQQSQAPTSVDLTQFYK